MDKQIKSRERVSEHGEVYTAEREVNAMLDLVKEETERIDSRFLEPACGDGNFLAEILRRKLKVCEKYKKVESDYNRYAVLAITSIYGVDILQDNVDECIERLYGIWCDTYKSVMRKTPSIELSQCVKYILTKNILCGNALTMKLVDLAGNDREEPIIFAQWDFVIGDKIKRRDYRLDELIKGQTEEQIDMEMLLKGWEYDEELHAMMPSPICEYTPIEYWKVQEEEKGNE